MFQMKNLRISQGFFDTILGMPLWQKLLAMAASWVIPIGLAWMFFFSPRIGELKTITTNIPKLRQEVQQLEVKAQKIPQIRAEIEEMGHILTSAMKLLPDSKDIHSVLTEISNLGNEERLEFILFKPEQEKIEKFYASIPVSIELSGPFNNTMVFFDKVGRMARIVHINEVSMGQAKQGADVWSSTAFENSASLEKTTSSEGGDRPATTASSWTIKTKCQAVTYRFLTPEELKAAAEKEKQQGKKPPQGKKP